MLTLPPDPVEDNDKFDEKIALLLDDPVPMVSFTFGIPPRRVIAALQKAKSVVVQTVTTPERGGAGTRRRGRHARRAGGGPPAVTPARSSPRKPLSAGADRRAGPKRIVADGAAAGDGGGWARHPRARSPT